MARPFAFSRFWAHLRMGSFRPLVRGQLLGRELLVPEGALRAQPDYDDAWLLACARRAETVFDIGSNIGQSALLMLLLDNVREVVLVDANPEALTIAAETLIRNRLSAKARFVQAFVAESDQSAVRLWTVGAGAAGSIYPGHARSAARAGSSVMVPTLTVDTLCDLYAVTPELVKVDVEGAEHEVLRGSKTCVARMKTRFLVEMHSNPDLPMVENAARVLAWCDGAGFKAWYLKEGAHLRDPAQLQGRGRCHLLFQPAEWEYPDWLIGIRQSADLDTAMAPPDS